MQKVAKWGTWAAAAALLIALGIYRFVFHAVDVEAAQVRTGVLQEKIHGPGTVQARIGVVVSTRVTGLIAAVHADHGDHVRKGQLLATLDDRDLAAKTAAARAALSAARQNIGAAEAALRKAQADLALAQSTHKRNQEMFRKGYISQNALDTSEAALRSAESGEQSAAAALAARRAEVHNVEQELRYAETLLSYARITAPMDGVIIQREAEAGDTVMPGSPIFRMVDPATLWVVARIDETVAGRVRLNQPAHIHLRSGREVPGRVARIARQSDAATRELEVSVAFAEPQEYFTINEEAQVTILADETQGLLIPVSALVQREGRQAVLVVNDGRARLRPVRTGIVDGKHVLVQDGLGPDETVLSSPQNIRPGQRVRLRDGQGD